MAWRQLRLAEDVTALVSAATRHRHAAELASISAVYVELLAQRVADAPAAVSAFGPLCAALGEFGLLLCQHTSVSASRSCCLRLASQCLVHTGLETRQLCIGPLPPLTVARVGHHS